MPESESTLRALAKRLPKPQLHLHLDGSLPESILSTLSHTHATPLPVAPDRLRPYFLSLKSRQQSTDSYTQKPSGNWDTFNFINSLLRTPSDLHTATHATIRQLKLHNVTLAEIRFCPSLYPFPAAQAVDAVVAAFRHAGLKGGVILCALRSYPTAHVEHISRLAEEYRGRGVLGIDLAGDEATYPLAPHLPALRDAATKGINLTVHAGEWGPHASQNLLDALSIPVRRVGHALVLSDPSLRASMGDVFVETCLTANCSGGGKVPADEFALHPVKAMLEDGVRVAAFSCDNLLLSGTLASRPDPTEEIVRARRECGLNWRQIEAVLVDGVRASFDDTVFEQQEGGSFLERFQREVREILSDVIDE